MIEARRAALQFASILAIPIIAMLTQCSISRAVAQDEEAVASRFERVPQTNAELQALQIRFQELAQAYRKTVVDVGNGTGVIISPDGYVLTCLHVVLDQPDTFRVTVDGGRQVNVRKLGYNVNRDMCVLKISGDEVWHSAEMGYSALMNRGQWCLSIGYPAQAESTQSPLVRLGRFLATSPWWVCADTLTEGGDCGGPIFDADGKVIAINTGGSYSNRGSAHIPIDAFRLELDRLKRGDRYADLLVANRELSVMFGFAVVEDSDSVKIETVYPGSPAIDAGVQRFDVVTACNGAKVAEVGDLVMSLIEPSRRSSNEVLLHVNRGIEKDIQIAISRDRWFRVPAYETTEEYFSGSVWLSKHPEVERCQRNHPKVREAFKPSLETAASATVQIKIDGTRDRLGCVVHSSGYVATTSGGLVGALVCRFSDGTESNAELVNEDSEHRIAFLKLDSKPQNVVAMASQKELPVGSLISVAQPNQDPVAIGVVSCGPRDMHESFLNVVQWSEEFEVRSVISGTSLERAGLQQRDRITSINGVSVGSSLELRKQLVAHSIGNPLHLTVSRPDDEDNRRSVAIALDSFGYRNVFLHDAAVGPTHLGGPVVGIDGQVHGINVSRFHQISIGAVPITLVNDLLKEIVGGSKLRSAP